MSIGYLLLSLAAINVLFAVHSLSLIAKTETSARSGFAIWRQAVDIISTVAGLMLVALWYAYMNEVSASFLHPLAAISMFCVVVQVVICSAFINRLDMSRAV